MIHNDIRQATLEDAPAIAQIHVQTWQKAYRGQVPDTYLDTLDIVQRTKTWKKILLSGELKVFVADLKNDLVGFCTLGKSCDKDARKNTGEIGAIYIAPPVWRKGYGKKLIETAIDESKRMAFDTLTLWVLDSNTPAKLFYEQIGFRPDGTQKQENRTDFVLSEVRYCLTLKSQNI